MILQSTITCPRCGYVAVEEMPTDACQFFYDCKSVANGSSQSPVIAACSVRTEQSNAHQCRPEVVVADAKPSDGHKRSR